MSVAKLLGLSPEKTAKLAEAWQKAQLAAQGVRTKEDALNVLNSNGIDNGFMGKVNGYLNHPLAGMIAKGAGFNLDRIKQDIAGLQQMGNGDFGSWASGSSSSSGSGPQSAADPLAELRQGLQQLKH